MSLLAVALTLACSAAAAPASAARGPFEVDARVELFSAAFLLSEPPAADDGYARELRASCAALSGHPVVARAARLKRDGLAPLTATLALHVGPPPELSVRGSLPKSATEPFGGPQEAAAFLEDLRDFARRANFARFYDTHLTTYQNFLAAAEKEAARAMSPAAVTAYLGFAPGLEPRFVLAPLFPGTPGDTPSATAGGREFFVRPRGQFGGKRGFLFNSFEHSQAHALSRAAAQKLSPGSPRLQLALAKAVMLRVLAQDTGERMYRHRLGRLPSGSFLIEGVAEALKEYEADRARYPDLRAFYPQLEPFEHVNLEETRRLVRTGDRKAALAALASAARGPLSPSNGALVASLYSQLREYGPAEALLDRLIAVRPGAPLLRIELAEVLLRTGRHAEALASLDAALPMERDPWQLRRIARLRQDLKDYPGALAILSAMAEERPSDAGLRADLGLCEYLAGMEAKAVANLELSLKLDPSALSAASTLGAIYAARKRFDLELAVYTTVFAAQPRAGGDPKLRADIARRMESLKSGRPE